MKIPQGITLVKLESMTQEEARKLIAKDCLAWLNSEEVLVRQQNTYMGICLDRLGDSLGIQQANEVIGAYQGSCTVCAIGVLTIASVCRFNDIQAQDLRYSKEFFAYLEKFFEYKTLRRMERAFEEWTDEECEYPNEMRDFVDANPDSKERLRAIFTIVAETGDFIPPPIESVV